MSNGEKSKEDRGSHTQAETRSPEAGAQKPGEATGVLGQVAADPVVRQELAKLDSYYDQQEAKPLPEPKTLEPIKRGSVLSDGTQASRADLSASAHEADPPVCEVTKVKFGPQDKSHIEKVAESAGIDPKEFSQLPAGPRDRSVKTELHVKLPKPLKKPSRKSILIGVVLGAAVLGVGLRLSLVWLPKDREISRGEIDPVEPASAVSLASSRAPSSNDATDQNDVQAPDSSASTDSSDASSTVSDRGSVAPLKTATTAPAPSSKPAVSASPRSTSSVRVF